MDRAATVPDYVLRHIDANPATYGGNLCGEWSARHLALDLLDTRKERDALYELCTDMLTLWASAIDQANRTLRLINEGTFPERESTHRD